jgi:Co/Zn/Cd efflux system component
LVLLASVVLLALGISWSALSAAGASPAQEIEGEVTDGLERFGSLDGPAVSKDLDPFQVAPDLTVLVARAGEAGDAWVSDTRAGLLDYDAVKSVAVQPVGEDTAFHLWLVEPRPAWLSFNRIADELHELTVESVTADDSLVAPAIWVGGRARADGLIVGSFAGSVHWLALVAVMIGALLAWRLDWRRGLLSGVALVGSTYFGSRVGLGSAGEFDGTITTSPLVGAVAGLATALVICLRVMRWYRRDVDGDGADLIRRSLMEVVNDLVLALGAMVVVIGVLWIGGGLFRPLVGVVIGGLVGAAFTAAVVAPGLAVLHASNPSRIGQLEFRLPDGRQLVLLTVVGLVAILAVLAAFMFRSPGVDLLDHRSLDGDDPAHLVGARLGQGPGDPTDAVVAIGTDDRVEAWARAVSSFSDVAWVDTASGRYTGAGVDSVDPLQSLASEMHLGQRSEPVAVLVPSVPIRSADGARLLDTLETAADGGVELTEAARSLDRGSVTLVVLIVVLLALAGAGVVMIETENLGFAASSFALRLAGGAATVGVYRLLATDASAADTVAVLAVVGLLVGLFELEFMHDRLHSNELSRCTEGLSALLAAGAMVVAGLVLALGSVFGGGPGAGLFGLTLAVALGIELAVGSLVLRPVLFGEDAAYHTVARPFRSTIHSGQRPARSKPLSVDDPQWRRLVTDLLIAEFGLQTDPEVSRLEDVFLDGTPLYRQAAAQHRNLSSAHLRVTGLAPQVRRVETFREGRSTMLSVTVDHPERHLIDHDGTVYGVRKPERRSSMLWLVSSEPGQFRIAESIQLGSVSLDDDDSDTTSTVFPEVASVVG